MAGLGAGRASHRRPPWSAPTPKPPWTGTEMLFVAHELSLVHPVASYAPPVHSDFPYLTQRKQPNPTVPESARGVSVRQLQVGASCRAVARVPSPQHLSQLGGRADRRRSPGLGYQGAGCVCVLMCVCAGHKKWMHSSGGVACVTLPEPARGGQGRRRSGQSRGGG